MRRSDFAYDLPPKLIAQFPLPERSASRLLCLAGNGGGLRDLQFRDLPDLLRAEDLLVFNNTRVLKARLFAVKPTGGRVEILVERVVEPNTGQQGPTRELVISAMSGDLDDAGLNATLRESASGALRLGTLAGIGRAPRIGGGPPTRAGRRP